VVRKRKGVFTPQEWDNNLWTRLGGRMIKRKKLEGNDKEEEKLKLIKSYVTSNQLSPFS
jgi:hypothetical protein